MTSFKPVYRLEKYLTALVWNWTKEFMDLAKKAVKKHWHAMDKLR